MSPRRRTASPPAAPPVGWREAAAVASIAALFLLSQLLALLLRRPFAQSGVQGFEDPEDWRNSIWLFGTVLVFTVLILFVARRRHPGLIRALVLGSVGLTLVYVFFPLWDLVLPDALDATLGFDVAIAAALPPAVLLTVLLVKFPEWYVVDAVGVSVSAGAIALFGSSFTPVTYLLVLIVFAVYDYVSVYRTRHMLALADSVLDLHLPIMLVVPRHLSYSFRTERGGMQHPPAKGRRRRDALFIGLGDVVIPSIFAFTALPLGRGAVAGALAGITLGLLVLLAFVLRGRPHAGLPTLNAGAFLGFLVGLWLDRGTLVFW